MADPANNPTSTAVTATAAAFLSLPPGCRFCPSEEQLLCYYLAKKNDSSCGGDRGFDLIKEVDLYKYEPFGLPESMSFSYGCGGRRRHFYCYAARAGRKGSRRRAGCGFWKRRGGARDVMGGRGGKVVLGKRRTFVFYLGNAPSLDSRTDWVMHEYALASHSKASFVLCRVFVKSRSHTNNTSDHALSSCAEESVATIRHIGIQHDELITGVYEPKAYSRDIINDKNEIQSSKLNDQAVAGMETSPNTEIRSRGNEVGIVNATANQSLISFLEGDFIELNDLVCPLSGID